MPAPSAAAQNGSLRHRIRERLGRLRSKSRPRSDNVDIASTPRAQIEATLGTDIQVPSIHTLYQTRNDPKSTTAGDEAQTQIDQSTPHAVPHTSGPGQRPSAHHSTVDIDISVVFVPSDIWSAAYREAVDSLGKDIDVAILKGENVAQLFRQLEEIDKDPSQESVFLRGVKYLHSLQVPLEKFKLALDLATPLTNIEPATTIVFGVVRSVTAIAISFATADIDFAKQIGEMLEQISYIDDCDTLGQKTNKTDIHKALVLVYQKILEFYSVAFEILTKKRAKLVMNIVLENNRLPNIVQEFLGHADGLRRLVQKATWEIVEDIKTMLYDHEIARWLGSGKMSQQSKHHTDLQNLRADQACEFLLADSNFISWYRASDSQQLVILGDMGYGKTVAMAFLIDELRRRNEHQLPQPKICYHYCQDDETGQAVYIFCALLLSLLEQFSGLKRTFFEWYKQALASGNFEPATNIKELEEFLQKILETLDRPLFIVIDGLDECDRASQHALLETLKTLSQKTRRLKVILSSRPHEEILEQLVGIPRINLGSNAGRDRIIVEKTVDRKLFNLSKEVRALVIETLSHLAQGSSIWTKMIVELIEVRRIRALGPMQDFLEDIPLPGQLSKLYINLLSRHTSDDPENQKLATTALEVLAIARRPLSILELAWAVALGAAQKKVTTIIALAKLVDHQRVMSLIQPFVAHVDYGDVTKRQVKLVHQSVKEFIMKESALSQPGPQGPALSAATDQGLIHLFTGSLEAGILNICVRYLLLDDVGQTALFSEEQVAIDELPQEFDLFNNDEAPNDYNPYCTWEDWEENMIRYDPTDRGFGELFVYASSHWLDHFGAATAGPLPSLENIEKLCQAGSTRMDNWIKQYCRPDCTIKARFVFESSLYDPLSITSLYGSEAILRDMLENSDFNKDNYLPNLAMGAAEQIFQWGEFSRFKMLFRGSSVGPQLRNLEFFRLAMKRWFFNDTQCQDWEVVFDLVNDVSDILVKERWGNELLSIAASRGCLPIIQRLVDKAQHKADFRNELLHGPQGESQMHLLIGEAVLGNHVGVVEYLLKQQGIEVHLQHRNSHGENVLHLASKHGNPAIVQLLAPRLKEHILQMDDQGETALVRIITRSPASQGRYESARILLLEGGANGDEYTKDEQQNPLRIATRLGDLEMCRLLISVGNMYPLSAMRCDEDGRMVLKDETSGNEQNRSEILELLRAHADVGSDSSSSHRPRGKS